MFSYFRRLFRKTNTQDLEAIAESIFSDKAKDNFHRDGIFRQAGMTKLGFKSGIFRIIDPRFAERISTTSDPKERKLLQQVSVALRSVDESVECSREDNGNEIQNLATQLQAWFEYAGEASEPQELHNRIRDYVALMRQRQMQSSLLIRKCNQTTRECLK